MIDQDTAVRQLGEEERREIFAAVVRSQDKGMDWHLSRHAAAVRFGVSPDQVRLIEAEGIEQEWPPL
jgi:hypothetical protein